MHLAPLSLQEPVNSVKLIGEFCEWRKENGIAMQQKGEQWVLEADTLLEEGKPYSFVVNDKFRTHMPSAEVEFTTMRGNFNNLYQNKTIIFDPAAFAEHGTASKAEWAKGSIYQSGL